MPVDVLLVEGELDAQLLGAVFAGRPVVEAAKASKNALAPRVRTERRKGKPAYYLRDRDFDYDPPEGASSPTVDTVDREHDDAILGWRWCRHEIENYMLEPAVVARALHVAQEEFTEALVRSGMRIRHYEAARWSVGRARRRLPPLYRLETRPKGAANREFYLPDDPTEGRMRDWAVQHVSEFREGISPHLRSERVAANFETLRDVLSDKALSSVQHILLWFSGKDLLATLSEWLKARGFDGPGEARSVIRDWMIEHPDDTLAALEEWRGFRDCLREIA